MRYGQRLKLSREHAGLTQNELSLLTGIKVHTIAQIERGNQKTCYSTMKFSHAMSIEPMWLYSGEDKFAPDWFVVSELELLAIKQRVLLKRQAEFDDLRRREVIKKRFEAMDDEQKARVLGFINRMLRENIKAAQVDDFAKAMLNDENPPERRVSVEQRMDFDNRIKPDQTYQDVISGIDH